MEFIMAHYRHDAAAHEFFFQKLKEHQQVGGCYKEGHQEGVLTHSRDGIVDLHGFPVDVAVRTPSKARNLNNVTLKSK